MRLLNRSARGHCDWVWFGSGRANVGGEELRRRFVAFDFLVLAVSGSSVGERVTHPIKLRRVPLSLAGGMRGLRSFFQFGGSKPRSRNEAEHGEIGTTPPTEPPERISKQIHFNEYYLKNTKIV